MELKESVSCFAISTRALKGYHWQYGYISYAVGGSELSMCWLELITRKGTSRRWLLAGVYSDSDWAIAAIKGVRVDATRKIQLPRVAKTNLGYLLGFEEDHRH